MTPTTMGARVRVLRESRHLSLRDLAERSGVTKAYLVGIENDRKANLTLGTVAKVAGALGAEPAWIAYGVVPAARGEHPVQWPGDDTDQKNEQEDRP